uniref:Fas-binding factor 1 C-terminal domain-containing protein n=1 Tax=Hucho hucho TaxID=62062 RepID=A0A4W5MM47_9TELE
MRFYSILIFNRTLLNLRPLHKNYTEDMLHVTKLVTYYKLTSYSLSHSVYWCCRSLTVVIEQMEHFSHRLGNLSSRVENTHENTAQGLEQGERQREEQLRVMQDRLGQQQRAMAEERTRLKEVITKMDTQLAEQQRQLEKMHNREHPVGLYHRLVRQLLRPQP